MNYLKTVVLAFIIVFVIIELIINKRLRERINKLNSITLKNGKKIKVISVLLIILIIIITVIIIKNTIYIIKFSFINYNDYSALDDYKIGRQKAFDQRKEYNIIMENTPSDIEKSKNPYIPTGFKYLEGEWNTGYVISDEKGNEFVWVPCTNIKNNEKIPILKKWNQLPTANEKFFGCYETEEYKDFLISSIQNGGFYVSRYEIGKIDETPVSKKGADVWVNISCEEAKEISRKMYDDDRIHSRLINGYAYDTIFRFVWDDIRDKEVMIENEPKAGRNEYKAIYDIIDRMYELTSEEDMSYMIVRGCGAMEGYGDILDNRLILESNLTADNYGFRTVLYK